MTARTAIDLFAGCGGTSLGFIAAGWDVVAAVEWDKDAAETYRRNVGDHVIEADIATLSPDDLPDADYIHFSAPCQGHSHAGKRDLNDPRNKLWFEAFRIIKAKRPEWVTSENVVGMSTTGYDLLIMRAFDAIGYRMSRYRLNAADYGVPQTRKRVILIGNRLGLPNPCPTPTHAQPPRHLMLGLEPWVTVRQALGIGGTLRQSKRGNAFFDGDENPSRTVTAGVRSDHRLAFVDGPDPALLSPSSPLRKILDEPSRALPPGAHGQPGFSPRHVGGYVPDDILDSPSATIRYAGGGHDVSGDRLEKLGIRRPMGFVPNIPLDVPAPTIQGGGADTGGAEPVRHRLRGRASGDGDGQTFDEPAPTIPATWSMDVVDPEIGRRTYADAEGRAHTRPSNGAILRRLTVAECSRLQSFPEDYVFVGTQTSQYRQVGNAWPAGMAKAVAAAIKEEYER